MNYKQKLDPENYYRECLLLYTPWQHEETDLYHGKQTHAEAFDCMKNMIQHKMAVYEPMAQILREAVEVFENEQISREYDDVAPSTQHEETQHELLETTQSESFEFFDPDRPLSQQHDDIAPQLHLPPTTFQDSVEIIDNIMSDEEYRHHIQSLNKNQYELFSHIMNVATKKDKQELCWLNGGAGTGKSHLLKALYQGLYHICCTEPGQNRETNKVLIMAPTGKAAFNAQGTTIHAAFHIPANQKLQDYKPLSYDTLNTYRMKYRELEWILVDEISMVSNDLWKYVHLRLQEIKQCKEPFGGVNIIAIGDMYQL